MIAANIVVLAMNFNGMPDRMSRALDVANMVFTCLFAGEVVVRVLSQGPRKYLTNPANLFDLTIVVMGILDDFVLAGSSGISALRAFRAMRALRVLKLGRNFSALQRLIRVLRNTIPLVRAFAVIWLIFVAVFCLVGMQLFSGRMDFQDNENCCDSFCEKPRAHFDNFGWAFLTIFQMCTIENWCTSALFSFHTASFSLLPLSVTCVNCGFSALHGTALRMSYVCLPLSFVDWLIKARDRPLLAVVPFFVK